MANQTSVGIVLTVVCIFIVVGTFLPFVEGEFYSSSTSSQPDQLDNEISGNIDAEASINAFTILGSVLSMFFWTFGALPFWLDSFFLILRIGLVWGIVSLVRGV